ncbi:MAG: hypothetical protein WBW16_14155, partial [Bacteroidota bacterium]
SRASDSRAEPTAEKASFWRSNVGEGNGESAAEFQPPKDAIQQSSIRATRGSASSITPGTPSRALGSKIEPLAEGAIRPETLDYQVHPPAITNSDVHPVVTRTSSEEPPRAQASEPAFQLPATGLDETKRLLTRAATGQQPQSALRPVILRVAAEQGASLKKLVLRANSGVESFPDETTHALTPSPVVVHPNVVRRPAPPTSPTSGLQDSTLEPAPTIQVTIGRVEVRATSTPRRPGPPTPTVPVLSLEDYLRQHSSGGAR